MPPKSMASNRRRSRRLARLNPDPPTPNEEQSVAESGTPDMSQASTSSCTDRVASVAQGSDRLPVLQTDSEVRDLNDAATVVDLIQTATGSNEPENLFAGSSASNTPLPNLVSSPNTDLLVSNIQPSTSDTQHAASHTRRTIHQAGRRTISLRSHRHRRAPYMMYNRSIPSSLSVKVESYCDCPKTSRDLTCSCGEEDAVFEWTWDATGSGKSSACSLADGNRTAIFHMNYSSGTAAVKGTQVLSDGQYFWEIKMTSPVYGTDMMVGIGTNNVNLDTYRHTFTSLLGRDGDSWGLSYYGRFQQKGQFKQIGGAKFGQGSIIGLHIDTWHGTLSYYKNRRPLGVLCTGLTGKSLFPMVASTAARTTMKIIKACSFQTSLQFRCCQVLRQLIPPDLDVMAVVDLPPGLRAFLANNLSWLLRPSELHTHSRRKRARVEVEDYDSCSSEEEGRPSKRGRYRDTELYSEESDLEEMYPQQ